MLKKCCFVIAVLLSTTYLMPMQLVACDMVPSYEEIKRSNFTDLPKEIQYLILDFVCEKSDGDLSNDLLFRSDDEMSCVFLANIVKAYAHYALLNRNCKEAVDSKLSLKNDFGADLYRVLKTAKRKVVNLKSVYLLRKLYQIKDLNKFDMSKASKLEIEEAMILAHLMGYKNIEEHLKCVLYGLFQEDLRVIFFCSIIADRRRLLLGWLNSKTCGFFEGYFQTLQDEDRKYFEEEKDRIRKIKEHYFS